MPKVNAETNPILILKNNFSTLLKIPIVGNSGRIELGVKAVFKELDKKRMIRIPSVPEDMPKLIFRIEKEELVNPDGSIKLVQGSLEHQWIERAFMIENKGKLTLNIDNITIDKKGCYSSGFRILNCDRFTLEPNSTYSLWISFSTSNGMPTQISRKVYFVSGHRVFYLPLELDAPLHVITELKHPLLMLRINRLFIYQFSIFAIFFLIFLVNQFKKGRHSQLKFISLQSYIKDWVNRDQSGQSNSQQSAVIQAQDLKALITNLEQNYQIRSAQLKEQRKIDLNSRVQQSAPLKVNQQKESGKGKEKLPQKDRLTEQEQQALEKQKAVAENALGDGLPGKSKKKKKSKVKSLKEVKNTDNILLELEKEVRPRQEVFVEINQIEVELESKKIDEVVPFLNPNTINIDKDQNPSEPEQKEKIEIAIVDSPPLVDNNQQVPVQTKEIPQVQDENITSLGDRKKSLDLQNEEIQIKNRTDEEVQTPASGQNLGKTEKSQKPEKKTTAQPIQVAASVEKLVTQTNTKEKQEIAVPVKDTLVTKNQATVQKHKQEQPKSTQPNFTSIIPLNKANKPPSNPQNIQNGQQQISTDPKPKPNEKLAPPLPEKNTQKLDDSRIKNQKTGAKVNQNNQKAPEAPSKANLTQDQDIVSNKNPSKANHRSKEITKETPVNIFEAVVKDIKASKIAETQDLVTKPVAETKQTQPTAKITTTTNPNASFDNVKKNNKDKYASQEPEVEVNPTVATLQDQAQVI